MTKQLTLKQQQMVDIWDLHTQLEFEQKDVDATMQTMISADATVNNTATMMGGVGVDAVKYFYNNHFIHQLPKDTETELLSRTVGNDQIVDELIFKFTHTIQMDWILPGIKPTGKRVEIALVAIIKFEGDKIAHEHIYWDQASVLVQIGLLNPSHLPVIGIEGAQKVANPNSHPSNLLMGRIISDQ